MQPRAVAPIDRHRPPRPQIRDDAVLVEPLNTDGEMVEARVCALPYREMPFLPDRQLHEIRVLSRLARKRDGALRRITLESQEIAAPDQPEAVLQLSDAVERLAAVAPRLARVVDCRFFGGMTDEEIASVLDVTVRTVQRDWSKARMLLRRALEP